MNTIDEIISSIARKSLGVQTLEVRNSDRLDFHDIGVGGLAAALKEAYLSGANAALNGPEDLQSEIAASLNPKRGSDLRM